jgi:hypothetical protein
VLPSIGTGAESALREVAPSVFGAGVPGEETTSSVGASISPVQATTVWFHGVASEERYAKESNRAD